MAILDLRPKIELITAATLGSGLMAARAAKSLAWGAMRPFLKSALKSGFILYETGKDALAYAQAPEHSSNAESKPLKKETPKDSQPKESHPKQSRAKSQPKESHPKKKTVEKKETKNTTQSKKNEEVETKKSENAHG
jgi:outer membrane biosynthesis protein TonB